MYKPLGLEGFSAYGVKETRQDKHTRQDINKSRRSDCKEGGWNRSQ